MSAFTHNFNLGFFRGMFNGMFGGISAFNWGCWNFTPSFFTHSYSFGNFFNYQSPMPMSQSVFNYSAPSFTSVNNMNWQSFNYYTPQFQYDFNGIGDSFVLSSTRSPKKDKTGSAVELETGTQGYQYTSKISTSEYNQYNSLILKYAKEYNIDPNLVKAVIKQESCFKPNAKSSCGAMGLMQFMPATAEQYGVSNAYDPEENIKGGAKMLSDLLKKYDGNLKLALAAYNWGMGNLARKGIENAPAETRNYITNITNYYNEYKRA